MTVVHWSRPIQRGPVIAAQEEENNSSVNPGGPIERRISGGRLIDQELINRETEENRREVSEEAPRSLAGDSAAAGRNYLSFLEIKPSPNVPGSILARVEAGHARKMGKKR